jgi:hypothetical protein
MPYTKKQHGLFCLAAKNRKVAKKHGLSMKKAREMCSEGVKKVSRAMIR